MRIVDIIQFRKEAIMDEAVRFAQGLIPLANEELDSDVLRDHLPLILDAIVRDVEQPQTRQQGVDKSEGHSAVVLAETASQIHGRMRAESGLSVAQVVSEFRVLRSVILRMWSDSHPQADNAALIDMIRFNEAIDQAIAESVVFHSAVLLRWRSTLLAVIGHDLRGPLQSVMISAEYLAAQLRDTKSGAKADGIVKGAARLGNLLHSLLDYSKTEFGQPMGLTPRPVDLAVALQEEICLVQEAHPHIKISTDMRGDFTGEFDDSRLREALSNLLSNAVQYSDPGTPILVVAKDRSGSVRVEVTNQGEPIAPNARHTIFEPLRRANSERRAGTNYNMGIGLFIVREVARAHGGHADFDCAAGEITFWIEVPKSPLRANDTSTS